MKQLEIKPCPFCGAKARLENGYDYYNGYRIWCTGEDQHGLDYIGDTAEQTIEVWNKRI
jgi:hypothetical protein